MSWMQRFMAKFGYAKVVPDAPEPESDEFAEALCKFAEGTAETDRPAQFKRPTTVGESPLEPDDFEDTVFDLRPSEVVFDLSYRVEDKKTLRGWHPDPNVLSSACSQRPVTSVVDQISCMTPVPPETLPVQPQPQPATGFDRRSALERLLDPDLIYAEPYTPIP